MNLRKSFLSPGWYPRASGEVTRFISGCPEAAEKGFSCAAIAPHAGWYYSGSIAARAVSGLIRKVDTVVVIGGHLPPGSHPHFAMEDAVGTPLGDMVIDAQFRSALTGAIGGVDDNVPDNTVEVLLPMVKFYFPAAALLWVRLPANLSSYTAGGKIAAIAESLGRETAVLGSTDLTHYGPNYGFMPKGCGGEALDWVKEVNDRRFIEAVVSGNPGAALEEAQASKSSCSVGAVLGAMGFASAKGAGNFRLLQYGTSADADGGAVPDSFVGYAAFATSPKPD